jgi:hypothetical protein
MSKSDMYEEIFATPKFNNFIRTMNGLIRMLLVSISNRDDKAITDWGSTGVTMQTTNQSKRVRIKRRTKQTKNVAKPNECRIPRAREPIEVAGCQSCQPADLTMNTMVSSDTEPRYIIIDGSNVAMSHGKHKAFSSRGIKIAVDHFLELGHTNVVAMVPQYRSRVSNHKFPTLEPELLEKMQKSDNLVYTPDQSYDDRFIVKAAVRYKGLIVSNDKYFDLMTEKDDWKDYIRNNRIGFAFVGDFFQVPDDPMGRKGPKLQEMLSPQSATTKTDQKMRKKRVNGHLNRKKGSKTTQKLIAKT